ncbi:ATP-binding protein [Streptomyces sp. NPDC002004]
MNVPTVPGYYLVEVEASPERVPQMRRIVAAHLRYWGLDPQVEPVCRGVAELLRNVVEHAEDKTCMVELWWNGKHLIAAVADHERRMPRLLGPARGGLALVAALSDGWGVHGRPDGKVVWFSRRVKSAERQPLVARLPLTRLREAKRVPKTLSGAPAGVPEPHGDPESVIPEPAVARGPALAPEPVARRDRARVPAYRAVRASAAP